MLKNKPANPADISFARDCFEVVGERHEWVAQRLAPLYPKVFATYAAAAAAGYPNAKRRTVPVMRRVRWN